MASWNDVVLMVLRNSEGPLKLDEVRRYIRDLERTNVPLQTLDNATLEDMLREVPYVLVYQ